MPGGLVSVFSWLFFGRSCLTLCVVPKIHANLAGSLRALIQPRPKHLLQRDGYSRFPRLYICIRLPWHFGQSYAVSGLGSDGRSGGIRRGTTRRG